MTSVGNIGRASPSLASPRIMRPVRPQSSLEKTVFAASPEATLRALDDVIARLGPVSVAAGKENQSPTKPGKLAESESELYSTGCECLETLWGFESKKAVKSSEIDRRQLLLIQKLVSGSEKEIGFALEQIVVIFKRLFRRIAVDHEVFRMETQDAQLSKLLLVDVPPRKTVTAVVNIVVSLHLAMLKAFARSRVDDGVMEQLVASLKHPCGPVAWTGKTAASHKQAKLTTLSKLTAALSRQCTSNKLDAMKLQLVSMECSSDMSQMDLLTDTVQKMTDANVSEEERTSLISDLLKYLGGLDNELVVPGGVMEMEDDDSTPSVSIVEALADSEEFSLPTLLKAVRATDNKQMASQATLTAIEGFFKSTQKGGTVTDDQIQAMTSLLHLLKTGVQNLNIKKLLPTLCDYSSSILKTCHESAKTEHVHGCFMAVGDSLVELKDTAKMVLVSNLVFNLGVKSKNADSQISLLQLSTTLHKSAGTSEQYLMKCSKLATLLCEHKRWNDGLTHCSSVLMSLKDQTVLSEDAIVVKFVKLLAYSLLNMDNQVYTFPEHAGRPLVQIKLVQMLVGVIGQSSRLKEGVIPQLFRFQCDVLVGSERWLDLARLLTRNLAEASTLMDVSVDVLRSLVGVKIDRSPILDFHLVALETIYLHNPNLDHLLHLSGTIKPAAEDMEIVSLVSQYAACQSLFSLELKLHKFTSDKLALAQCYFNLGDVQRCKSTLREAGGETEPSRDIYHQLQLHQLHASSFLMEGQLDSAVKRLTKHTQLVSAHPVLSRDLAAGKTDSESPQDYCIRLTCQVRFWLVQSHLSFEQTQVEHAAATARKALSLSQAYLKRYSKSSSSIFKFSQLPVHVWEMNSLNLQAAILTTTSLLHLGLWREAEQVMTQSIALHESVGHVILLSEAQSLLGWLQMKKGDYSASQNTLAAACASREQDTIDDVSRALLYARVGSFHYKTGELEESFAQYERALQVINSMSDSSGLSRDMSQLRVERRKKPAASSAAGVLPGLRRLVAQVERLKVELQLAQDQKVANPASSGLGKYDQCLDQLVESRIALFSARKLLSSDAIFMGLEESAISIPSASTCDIAMHPNGNVHAAHGMLCSAKKSLGERIQDLFETSSQIEINEALFLLSSLDVFVSALGTTNYTTSWLDFRGVAADKRRRVLSSMTVDEWSVSAVPSASSHVDLNAKSLLSKLPDTWNVISLAICPTSGDLIVCQYAYNQDPFLLRLPLHRHNSRDVDEHPFLFSDGLDELKSIISESDTMTRNGASFPGGSEAWWAKRHELDARLKQLLHDAEFCWFGGFLGILGETVGSGCETFAKSFNRILTKHLPSRNGTGRRKKGFKPVTIDPRVLSLFLGMGKDDIAPELLEDLVYFVLDILQFHGEYNAYDELDTDQIFVEIEEAIGLHFSDDAKNRHKYTHTVLVLDSATTQFPWENMSSLCGRSVSRVSSLQVLSQLLDTCEPDGEPYYILNPGGDLPKTQDRFEDALSPFSGVVGTPPSESDWLKALKTSSVMIYMGHGGGDKYIRNSSIAKLEQCCPTVLLGCSSGVIRSAGELEPWGIPMAYMSAGCPSLVANLWDVTDKDIDKFGRQFLTRWGVLDDDSLDTSMDCSMALSQSRNECLLRYLNGAAPVLYGIPTFYNQH
ncbi:Separin [Yarrowia sp. C11]|nr:Separin [Yarrowia sp. E02]KAG5373374.1 Separin [Yarrowia sp. C11]